MTVTIGAVRLCEIIWVNLMAEDDKAAEKMKPGRKAGQEGQKAAAAPAAAADSGGSAANTVRVAQEKAVHIAAAAGQGADMSPVAANIMAAQLTVNHQNTAQTPPATGAAPPGGAKRGKESAAAEADKSIFGLLQLKDFRNLWLTTLISNLGGLVQGVGAGWLMTLITSSHSLVGLVQGATTLPVVIFSLWAGALADNFNRRMILIMSLVAMMLASLVLAVLTYAGWVTPAILLFFTFLIGCGNAVYNPPWQATVGDIVPREQIPVAVSLNSVGYNLMRSMGPAIGGAIVALWGGVAAFVFNVFSYIPLIGALYAWRPEYSRPTLPREKLVGAMSDGLRYVMMSPNLLNIMLRSFLFGLGAISLFALLPVVAREAQGGAFLYGILLGCFGIGAIIGGTYNIKIRARLSSEKIIVLSFLGYAAACLIVAFSPYIWLSCLALFPAGMCWVLALALFNANVQLSTPRWVVSRALAFYQTASYAGMAAGSWLWGALGDSYGTRASLCICGICLCLGAVAGLKFRIYDIGTINLSPTDPMREPELRLDLQARSGPILITLEYHIAQKNTAEFLQAMTERRRIRLRDGARQWTLLRDLEKPERWVETYHMPTWVDYLRHNQRSTQDDLQVIEILDKLNEGSAPPYVCRMIERQTVPLAHELPLKPPAKI
ncbi:MFS transporter [Candidatus Tokpelaia sp.]|uniref:MFS transporter n=1 Tax=Candidatus Tokpelaia sp. TaxID=2233777 RepID=UPI001FF026D6|nr:MFS transporter [Candidatus Tokpelaia sp.]